MRNDSFSPGQQRGRDKAGNFSSVRSPPGRNMTNNFSTINNSNMHSIDLNSNKNYMVYPRGEVDNSFAEKQYNMNSGIPQYVMSMSTNINLGIIQDAINSNQMQHQHINSINLKNSIASRGNFRKNKKPKRNGDSKNYMPQFQDSQTFSRINNKGISESINKGISLFSPTQDEPEPYEYKAIDSQIGSLMKRDYTVDRSQLRNNNNLASLIVTSGKVDSTISPNPRHARLNDSLMFKSTNNPNQTLNSIIYNAQEETKKLTLNRNLVSPSKDNRNIKLEPIEHPSSKHKSNVIYAQFLFIFRT
jgi:hypothetical protein